MNIKTLESRDTKVTSQTVSGLSVKAFIYQDTYVSGATLGSSTVDFTKTQIKVILNRDGQDHIIMQDNLKLLGLASTLNTRGQLAFYSNHDHQSFLANGQALVTFNLNFGGHIDIHGSDFLYVQVANSAGLFAAGYTATSFLEIKPLQSVGYEEFIPQVKSINIQAGTTSDVFSLGDGVARAVILNYDKLDFTAPVIQNINFASTMLNDSYTYFDLLNFKDASFASTPVNLSANEATILESDQSFILVDFHRKKVDGLILNCAFDGTQLTASNNFIVYWSTKTSWTILQNAKNKATSHQNAVNSAIPASIK